MAGNSWKGKDMETDEFIIRSGVRPFCKRELEFALSSQRHILDFPRTRTRLNTDEKKPRTSDGFSMNPRGIVIGDMAPPSMIHYQEDQSHSNSSSHELAMALSLSMPASKRETPVLEECGRSLLKKMMASASHSVGSVEVDFSCLPSTESQLDQAEMMNSDLKMLGSFLSMDLQKNPRDHHALSMLDGQCLQHVASQQQVVRPYEFELHAGSTMKYPWGNTFMEDSLTNREVHQGKVVVPLQASKTVLKNPASSEPLKDSLASHHLPGSINFVGDIFLGPSQSHPQQVLSSSHHREKKDRLFRSGVVLEMPVSVAETSIPLPKMTISMPSTIISSSQNPARKSSFVDSLPGNPLVISKIRAFIEKTSILVSEPFDCEALISKKVSTSIIASFVSETYIYTPKALFFLLEANITIPKLLAFMPKTHAPVQKIHVAAPEKHFVITEEHVSTPQIANIAPKAIAPQKKTDGGRLTKKDVGMHKLIFSSDTIPARPKEVGYYVRKQNLLGGYLVDSGILCSCCNDVVSPSQFEAHAGQAKRRKPYNHIFTSDGVSLHNLAISLSKDRKLPISETDDLCSICEDGGDLLICDLCPRVFHKECVGLTEFPKGDWYCQWCANQQPRKKRVGRKINTYDAGKTIETKPIEQIYQRCSRVITEHGNYAGGCAICSGLDFSKSKKFGPRTVLICDQCEKEYHVSCLKKNNITDLKELPEGEWFCCDHCSRIHRILQKLIHDGSLPIFFPELNSLLQKQKDKGFSANGNVKWRLLRGKDSCSDTKFLLSKALATFHESFDPIVDVATGQDLIPKIIFGKSTRDQDFSGVYCAILTVESSVVSVGVLRVLGGQVAELPLIATKREFQGQGYMRLLFNTMQRMLVVVKVKHFVLPAAAEVEAMWINKFGFSRVTPQELQEFTKGVQPMMFEGTSMLHKLVPPEGVLLDRVVF